MLCDDCSPFVARSVCFLHFSLVSSAIWFGWKFPTQYRGRLFNLRPPCSAARLQLWQLYVVWLDIERQIVKFWGTQSFKKPTIRICCSTTFTRSISEVWNKAENSEHWFRLDKCDHSRWWTHTLYFETGQSRKHFILLLLFRSQNFIWDFCFIVRTPYGHMVVIWKSYSTYQQNASDVEKWEI